MGGQAGSSSADLEALEQGCSFKINRCYLCNSESGGVGGARKKKCLGISQLHKAPFACSEPSPCPAAGWCVVGVCVCMFTFGSVIESGRGWGRGLPFSAGGWVRLRQKKKKKREMCLTAT